MGCQLQLLGGWGEGGRKGLCLVCKGSFKGWQRARGEAEAEMGTPWLLGGIGETGGGREVNSGFPLLPGSP